MLAESMQEGREAGTTAECHNAKASRMQGVDVLIRCWQTVFFDQILVQCG